MFLSLGSCKEQTPTTTEIEFQDLAKGLTIEAINHRGNAWQVVTMDPDKSSPSVRLSDSTGKPLRDFSAFQDVAQKANETIIWMMNAGMFHKGGSPVGLCISDRAFGWLGYSWMGAAVLMSFTDFSRCSR